MLENGTVLTLENNNEYTIVDKYSDNNIIYVYLVDINNNSNIIYGKLENDEIVEITNPVELEKVIQQVYKNLHNK